MTNIIIIGASHAGISAAVNLSNYIKKIEQSFNKSSEKCNIKLIEQNSSEGFSFVGANGLFWVSGLLEKDEMGYTSPKDVKKRGIELLLNSLVNKIDTVAKTVTVYDKLKDTESEYSYDYLILATGSSPIIPDFAKNAILTGKYNGKMVQSVKSYNDALKLREISKNDNIKNIAVVGGGYIGVETAETLSKCGKKVTIIQSYNRLMNSYYDQPFTDLIEQSLSKHEIKITKETRLNSFDNEVNGIIPSNFDAFIFAIGFKPNTELLNDELELFKNAYLVDNHQKTSNDSIFAIGDCCTSFSNSLGENIYLPIGSSTSREASIVADVILRKIYHIEKIDETFGKNKIIQTNNGVQGANALTVYGLNVSSVGITLDTALQFGIDAKSIDFTGAVIDNALKNPFICDENQENAKGSILDDGKMKICIVYDNETMRILGFQAVSYVDPSAYCHMFSLAISHNMNLGDLKNLDLFFSPLINQLYNHITRVLSKL